MSDPFSVAVLAGGQSRRMGTDKALVPFGPEQIPLAKRVLDRLGSLTDDLFLVSESRPGYESFHVPIKPDLFPAAGALGGIATAIAGARHQHVFVVACDLPFVNPSLVASFAARPRDYDVLIPRFPGESRQGGRYVFQTLHAIYGRGCLPPIERQLAEGNRQVVGFFDAVRVEAVDEATIRALDPDLRSFFNANTPEALAEANRIAAAAGR